MTNPLVAQKKDSTTWHTGVSVLDDAAGVYQGVQSGSWIEGGIAAIGTGMDLLTMAMNPVGTLISYGLNWLIEHVKPLQDALNQLAGDADQIAAYSQTWKNVAQAVQSAGKDLAATVEKDTANWTGQAADTYRANIKDKIDHINAAATCAEIISVVVQIVGVITGAVRGLVRDMVTQAVGDFIQDALEEVCSLGLGTPAVVAQVVEQVSAWTEKIGAVIKKLINSVEALRPMMSKLEEIFAAIKKVMAALHGHSGEEPHLGGDGSTHASSFDDTPTTRGGDSTTPAGDHVGGPNDHGADVPDTPSGTRDGGTSSSGAGDGRVKDSVDDPKTDSRETECAPGSGDPVDLATGQMYMTQFDVELPGMLSLILKRTHFSHYRAGKAFGRSWASSLDQRLEIEGDGVYFVDDSATRLIFPRPVAGGAPVLAADGPRWQLALSDVGLYTIHKPESGRTLTFGQGRDGTYPLATIANRRGHVIEFHYDTTLAPTAVTHSGGYHVGMDTENGRVVRLWLNNSEGDAITISRYGYDDRGDLVEVINSSDRAFRLEYDEVGRITKWIDRNDQWYQYFYDGRGRVVRTDGSGRAITGTWDYDSAPSTTLYTNSLGETMTYRLNERRQVIELIDPLGHSTRQEWDRFDRLLSRTDALGRTTRYTYDDDGNVTVVTRADGTQTVAEYNDIGLPTVVVEPDGAVWRYEYDDNGDVSASTNPTGARTEYRYNDNGGLASVTDPAGQTRRIEADAAGLPVAVTNALGETTRYVRDQFGRITAVVDPAGQVTRQTWTIEGRLGSRSLPDGTSVTWRHDGEGDQIEYVDPMGAVTRIERTYFGLPAVEIGPDSSRLRYSYDSELRLVSVTNEQGLMWRYEYDAAGNRVREIDYDGRVLSYEHDAAGQVLRRTNGAGQTVGYTYDLMGNVLERRSDGVTSSFRYDELGRLLSAANAEVRLELQYDRLGRTVRETVNGASVHSGYDVLGRRVLRRTPSGAESRWAYDPEGRPVSLASGGHSIMFQHDILGRETERLLDTGTIVAQFWDVNSRLAEQTVSSLTGAATNRSRAARLQHRAYQYRADGLIESVADQVRGSSRFELDAKGRITQAGARTGQQRFAYDPAGNIIRSDTPDGRPTQPWSYLGTRLVETANVRYSYDHEGRVIFRQRKRLSASADNWHYQWNSESRLVGVTTPDGTRWRYVYDPLGRRVAKQRLTRDGSGVAEQVTFHWDGTVVAEQETSGGLVTAWDWDPDGYRPLTQVERARLAPQQWVDRQFYSIVTDVIGTATELVDAQGTLVWHAESTIWGQALSQLTSRAGTPWRFQGQYHDPETGLHYNYARYYDPATGRYCSVDPLGLGGGPNARSYAHNPVNWCDPLGLIVIWGKKKCLATTENGKQTMSGWSDRPPPPPGTTRVPPADVLQLQQQIGHPIKPNSFLDNGVPGQHYASHAERQAAVIDPNAPVNIDLPQCQDCQEFYQKLAQYRGQAQVVTGPDGTRTFLPDGSVHFDPR